MVPFLFKEMKIRQHHVLLHIDLWKKLAMYQFNGISINLSAVHTVISRELL